MARAHNFIDITGQKFNRLRVIKYIGNSLWMCECECGNIKFANGTSLRKGTVKSCGCFKKEIDKQKAIKMGYINRKYKNLPQDKRYAKLMRVYNFMIERCYNKKHFAYKNYGKRGIKVCKEWKKDFGNFYNWAINNGFTMNKNWYECKIDRINVNGNYEPSNCRWVNAKIQSRNTRRNKLITYKNETHCVTEWGEILNISIGRIYARISAGLEPEKILDKKKKVNQYG